MTPSRSHPGGPRPPSSQPKRTQTSIVSPTRTQTSTISLRRTQISSVSPSRSQNFIRVRLVSFLIYRLADLLMWLGVGSYVAQSSSLEHLAVGSLGAHSLKLPTRFPTGSSVIRLSWKIGHNHLRREFSGRVGLFCVFFVCVWLNFSLLWLILIPATPQKTPDEIIFFPEIYFTSILHCGQLCFPGGKALVPFIFISQLQLW